MAKTVLVGVDDHATAHDAVVLGSALAGATHDVLAVAHIFPVDPLASSVALGAPGADPLRDESEAIVEHAVAGVSGDVRRIVAPAGSVAAGLHLQAESERAELIVVGSSHRGRVGRAALGTHATRVLHGAPCAVAVAPRGLAERGLQLRRIGVALDGSGEAADALELARRIGRATGAQVHLITVLPPQVAPWGRYRYVPDAAGYSERARAEAERVQAVRHPEETAEIRAGAVVDELLEAARELDLLVVGSRSYGPLRRVLLGGVSDAVVRAADCPVVVVPRSTRATQSVPSPSTVPAVAI